MMRGFWRFRPRIICKDPKFIYLYIGTEQTKEHLELSLSLSSGTLSLSPSLSLSLFLVLSLTLCLPPSKTKPRLQVRTACQQPSRRNDLCLPNTRSLDAATETFDPQEGTPEPNGLQPIEGSYPKPSYEQCVLGTKYSSLQYTLQVGDSRSDVLLD